MTLTRYIFNRWVKFLRAPSTAVLTWFKAEKDGNHVTEARFICCAWKENKQKRGMRGKKNRWCIKEHGLAQEWADPSKRFARGLWQTAARWHFDTCFWLTQTNRVILSVSLKYQLFYFIYIYLLFIYCLFTHTPIIRNIHFVWSRCHLRHSRVILSISLKYQLLYFLSFLSSPLSVYA